MHSLCLDLSLASDCKPTPCARGRLPRVLALAPRVSQGGPRSLAQPSSCHGCQVFLEPPEGRNAGWCAWGWGGRTCSLCHPCPDAVFWGLGGHSTQCPGLPSVALPHPPSRHPDTPRPLPARHSWDPSLTLVRPGPQEPSPQDRGALPSRGWKSSCLQTIRLGHQVGQRRGRHAPPAPASRRALLPTALRERTRACRCSCASTSLP